MAGAVGWRRLRAVPRVVALGAITLLMAACTLPFGGSSGAGAGDHKLPFDDGGAAQLLSELTTMTGGGADLQVTRVLFYPEHASFTVLANKACDLDEYSWHKLSGWAARKPQTMTDSTRDAARKAAFTVAEIKPEILPGLRAKGDAARPPAKTGYFIIERNVFQGSQVTWSAYVTGERESFRLVADTTGRVIEEK